MYTEIHQNPLVAVISSLCVLKGPMADGKSTFLSVHMVDTLAGYCFSKLDQQAFFRK